MSSGRGVYIIAEAGVNHNGSVEMALEMIDVAARVGADAVKFQTFKTEKVMSRFAPKADYQKQTTGAEESQFEMVKKLELDEAAHRLLIRRCEERGIQFLSTPFDIGSVSLLAQSLKVPRLKIPSGEITNAPLVLAVARTGLPVILSTGMSTLADVENALGVLAFGYTDPDAAPSPQGFADAYASPAGQAALKEKVVLLHCTTEYPAAYSDVNLNVMNTMRAAFSLPVGLSDHTPGIAVSVGAVAMGAQMIEKHFTLDQNLPGPDHQASLEPDQLKELVDSIRQVEKALGSSIKVPAGGEVKNMPIARKSLVAATAIKAGEAFTPENLTVKRPGTGVSPFMYWEYLGKTAGKDYNEDDVISKQS